MKPPLGIACALTLCAATPVLAQQTVVSENATRKSFIGPAGYFTGTAIVDRVFSPNDVWKTSAGFVTFARGARSAWHSHPAGQTLIVTSGTSWTPDHGGEKLRITAGDVVWTPPGVKHWHGATDVTSMGHYSILDFVDGSVVEWMEKVSDEEYLK